MKTARFKMAMASASAMNPIAGLTIFMKVACGMLSTNVSSGSALGSYWLSRITLSWCMTNLAAVQHSLRMVSCPPHQKNIRKGFLLLDWLTANLAIVVERRDAIVEVDPAEKVKVTR